MAEKVEVDIEVNSNLEPTIANLKELKKQLRLAAAGSAEFNKLSAAIRDTEDAIDGAKLGANDLAGALEDAPGPIGNIAKGMKKVELATKSFGAAFKAIGIGLLVSTIGLLVTAFGKTEGSMKALEPVMIMLEKALGGLVQAFTPFLEMFAELVIQILPYAIKGISSFYGGLVSLFTLIKEAGTGAAKIVAGILTQDYKLANEGLTQLQGAWGKTTDAFNEFQSDFDKGYANQSETEKKNAEEQAALAKEAADRRKAAAEAAQKIREEQLAKAKAADAVELEAYKATLTERERLELEAALKLDEQKKVLLQAGRKDFSSIEEQYRITLAEIKTKYDEEEAKKQEELDKKAADDLKKKLEDERGILLTDLQARLEELDRQNQLAELDFQQDLERFKEQRDILAQQEQTELLNTELTEFQKTEIRKKYADARQKITDGEIATEKSAMQAKHDINMAYLGLFEQFGSVLGQIAGKNKKLAISGVVIQQAAAIGQIIASTAIANAKAVAATPLTSGLPFVAINTISAGLSIASTIAGAAKSIQQINAQPGGTGGSGGGGGAPSTPPPSFGGGPASMGAPQIQTTAGASPSSQIAQTIGAAQNKPIVAQVVSTAVSSQAALDRRTNGAATFGGG